MQERLLTGLSWGPLRWIWSNEAVFIDMLYASNLPVQMESIFYWHILMPNQHKCFSSHITYTWLITHNHSSVFVICNFYSNKTHLQIYILKKDKLTLSLITLLLSWDFFGIFSARCWLEIYLLTESLWASCSWCVKCCSLPSFSALFDMVGGIVKETLKVLFITIYKNILSLL